MIEMQSETLAPSAPLTLRVNQPITRAQHELVQLARVNFFRAAVLTDDDGLPIAAFPPAEVEQAEMIAAVAPLVHRMVQRSNERAGLALADEVVINNADRSRLICRFFLAKDQGLILACVVPPKLAYRRAMLASMRAIQKFWAHE